MLSKGLGKKYYCMVRRIPKVIYAIGDERNEEFEMKDCKVNCYHCKFYYITWDKKFPRGCRFFGFKTHKLPSVVVFESSGKPCYGFKSKKDQ